ncbi:MAG: PAS domain S-box protein [Dehalococcoidales bacterium]|nr:PAS domain S-box protein [Dehalococcoidales bacterium]
MERVITEMEHLAAELRKPYFWAVIAIFFAGVFLYYSRYLPAAAFAPDSLLGLESHSIERIVFLVVIILGGLASGLITGLVYVVLSAAAMLPYIFLPSNFSADAVFEICLVIILGIGFNLWLATHRREVGKREQVLLKLEAIQHEVREHIKTVRESEKRISLLRSVTAAINQFSSLDDILATAVAKVKESVEIDGVLIYLLNNVKNQLELRQYSGVSEEFADDVKYVKGGEDFNGRIVDTGQPLGEDSANRPRLLPAVEKEGIVSQFIVPLTAREKVVGMLCVLSYSPKRFTTEEEQLLSLIGSELGVAVERASLSEEKERAGRRFKELFEKAHDSIWVQDFDGKVLDANQATADYTGYPLDEVIGSYIFQSLDSKGLELAREVRRKMLSGVKVEQPYEQKVIRKDGSEATIMLTTSLIQEEGTPPVFQHIARDVTREKKLAENLRLYAQQITQAYEEERKRIARELHDDSIQALIILSREIDELVSHQPKNGRMIRPLEGIRGEIDDILARIRRFTHDLRPPTLDYLGLIPAVRELVSQLTTQSDITAELYVSGQEKHFTSSEEMLIYRIIQETLRNVGRHSGAKSVQVSIKFESDSTVVEIKDDGKGFEISESMGFVQAGKIGLAGIQERAELLGGKLSISSKVGEGTILTLIIPKERWKK